MSTSRSHVNVLELVYSPACKIIPILNIKNKENICNTFFGGQIIKKKGFFKRPKKFLPLSESTILISK